MADNDARKITIIGLGLIGGSLGLALKASELPGITIVGHDRERGAENEAKRIGAIDQAEHNLPRAVEGASLVIIATPVLAVREVMEQIAPDLDEGTVVTDTASTKANVMRWAREILPQGVNFVGGHPMAGKETSGIAAAEATLFREKAYCICPSVTASESAVKTITGLANSVGAEPLFIDPEEHDQYAAAISHLPMVMSTALFSLMRSSPSWDDMAQLASSGFRDATRLASSDASMSHDIVTTNREAIIHWLERMERELARFRRLLEDAEDAELLETLARIQLERDHFMASPPKRAAAGAPSGVSGTRSVLVDMLVGGMIGDKLRKMEKDTKLGEQETAGQAGDADEPEEAKRPGFADRVAEGVRRDLEKLEAERAKKANSDQGDAAKPEE
jgi:prephenate dehydrogenase